MYSIFDLLLPVCAICFSTLLIIVYFMKKRVNLVENRMYGTMLICVLVDSILVFFEKTLVINRQITAVSPFSRFMVSILNKLDAASLIILTTCLFMYIFVITLNPTEKEYKKVLHCSSIIDAIFIFVIFFLDVHLITDGTIISISGTALYPTYVACLLYILASIIITLRNIKRITRKHVPLFVLIVIFILLILIFTVNPYITVISIFLTFSNYVMYHTIENPDIKMLEELHRAKEISDSANEEKAMFLYNMTQEIRGITSKIDDYADTILDSKDWEETYNNARDIKATTSKFTNIANDILDVSNIDSDNMKVYNSKYNIKTIMKQLISIYTDKCKGKELQFITNIDHDIPEELYGDSIGLKEILNTLLDNAYNYTSKGYIEFDVNVVIKNDICRLLVTIEDSGEGIKSEDINNIKTSNTSLAKANNLIVKMNGAMLISSDFGVGTKVKIVLDQRIVLDNNTEVSKYDSVFDNTNILCVDDSEAGLKIIDKLLKGTKIKIDKAESGKECLDKIRINKYDVILLDEELSQVSGIELMGKIKEIRNFNTPVIFMTKDNNYEYNEEYLNDGFSDYIIKPIKKAELLDKINKYTKKDN